MVIDHALGIAGGARGVVERDRVPFVARQRPRKIRGARGDEILVFGRAQPLARAGELGVVIIDHQGLGLASASASFTSLENSRSAISTFDSAWSIWNATTAASSRVLMVLSTAPAIGTP